MELGRSIGSEAQQRALDVIREILEYLMFGLYREERAPAEVGELVSNVKGTSQFKWSAGKGAPILPHPS